MLQLLQKYPRLVKKSRASSPERSVPGSGPILEHGSLRFCGCLVSVLTGLLEDLGSLHQRVFPGGPDREIILRPATVEQVIEAIRHATGFSSHLNFQNRYIFRFLRNCGSTLSQSLYVCFFFPSKLSSFRFFSRLLILRVCLVMSSLLYTTSLTLLNHERCIRLFVFPVRQVVCVCILIVGHAGRMSAHACGNITTHVHVARSILGYGHEKKGGNFKQQFSISVI